MNYYQPMIERIYQSKKPTTPEELKEDELKIQSRSFSRGSIKYLRLCLLKSPTVPDAIKNLWLTKREGERLRVQRNPEFVEEGIKDRRRIKRDESDFFTFFFWLQFWGVTSDAVRSGCFQNKIRLKILGKMNRSDFRSESVNFLREQKEGNPSAPWAISSIRRLA